MSKAYQYFLQVVKRVIGTPFRARHTELSLIASVDDDVQPSKRLVSIAIRAIQKTPSVNVDALVKRQNMDVINIWPGEHYKLLGGLVQTLKPKVIVEIGTEQGVSALAMKQHLPKNGIIHTFDITPWHTLTPTFLKKSDFDGRLVQYVGDPSDPKIYAKYKKLFQQADLIFIDAAKDGTFEYKLWDLMQKHGVKNGAILVYDDIKLWDMLHFWRTRQMPKLDITSFGHWCGTGLIEWKK